MKIKIKDIEKKFNIKIRRNVASLGLDTATKTGYCIAKSNTRYIYFDEEEQATK